MARLLSTDGITGQKGLVYLCVAFPPRISRGPERRNRAILVDRPGQSWRWNRNFSEEGPGRGRVQPPVADGRFAAPMFHFSLKKGPSRPLGQHIDFRLFPGPLSAQKRPQNSWAPGVIGKTGRSLKAWRFRPHLGRLVARRNALAPSWRKRKLGPANSIFGDQASPNWPKRQKRLCNGRRGRQSFGRLRSRFERDREGCQVTLLLRLLPFLAHSKFPRRAPNCPNQPHWAFSCFGRRCPRASLPWKHIEF